MNLCTPPHKLDLLLALTQFNMVSLERDKASTRTHLSFLTRSSEHSFDLIFYKGIYRSWWVKTSFLQLLKKNPFSTMYQGGFNEFDLIWKCKHLQNANSVGGMCGVLIYWLQGLFMKQFNYAFIQGCVVTGSLGQRQQVGDNKCHARCTKLS